MQAMKQLGLFLVTLMFAKTKQLTVTAKEHER
jgi:hypothetical protein